MAIGVDVGTSAVRAVEVEPRRGGPARLTRCGEVPLPPGAVVDGDVVDPDLVAAALRELWRAAGIRGRDVAIGLASQRVTVRRLELPELPDPELAEAVRLQAQDQLPIPVDEALLDHVVVDRRTVDDGRPTVRVLLVAAEEDMVERLLGAVTAAKLRPVLVDLDAFALLRSIASPSLTDDEAEVVVDIGAAVTKIAVHRGGRPLFVRMVRLGGDAATRDIQKALELSWDDAEKAKLLAGDTMAAGDEVDPDDERARAVQEGVRRVVSEIRHSLDFFRTQHDDEEVSRVLLSGGASLAPELRHELHAALEVPVERGDPLRAVDASQARKAPFDPRDRRPFLAVPIGLALGLLR